MPVATPMPRNFLRVAALASGATINKLRFVSLKVKTPELHKDYSLWFIGTGYKMMSFGGPEEDVHRG
jgi:hypothetical protein